MQLGLTRERQTADAAGARLTATNIEPGVVYALLDHVTDYVWFRPYVGSTLSFHRQTLSANGPAPAESTSDRGIGFRMFGGGEITFASLPRFGVSADLGYRRLPAALGGIDTNPLSVSIAGHVYIK
jgi:hypothetical protein